MYSGDQLSQSVQKFCGTVIGLIYGMMIWCACFQFQVVGQDSDLCGADIGAGRGSGSRPGLGAAFFVFMIPALAIRLYGPPQYMQASVMGAITTVLVVSPPPSLLRYRSNDIRSAGWI